MYLFGVLIIFITGQLGFMFGDSNLGMSAILAILALTMIKLNDK